MPDLKEKLVELADDVLRYLPWGEVQRDTAEQIADRMIDHGVTIQKWIPVSDPPKEKGCYLISCDHRWDGKPVAREAFWNGNDWLSCYDKGNFSNRVTHWQYLPQPPNEE